MHSLCLVRIHYSCIFQTWQLEVPISRIPQPAALELFFFFNKTLVKWNSELVVSLDWIFHRSSQRGEASSKSSLFTVLSCLADPPSVDGGSEVSEYLLEMANGDQEERRQAYRGHALECTANGLLPGRTYCFWIRAANKAGVGICVGGVSINGLLKAMFFKLGNLQDGWTSTARWPS